MAIYSTSWFTTSNLHLPKGKHVTG